MLNRFARMLEGISANTRALMAEPYTNLLVSTDFAGWSLDEDARELISLAGKLGFPAYRAHHPIRSLKQCVHYTSFFSLEDPRVFQSDHRISVDYYHGKPARDPAFQRVFESIKKHSSRLERIRLSYSEMVPIAIEAGIDPRKIHLIPIGINPAFFSPQSAANKAAQREKLRIPASSAVIGSFQKDGQGWGEGLEPKLIKGPDIFLQTMQILKRSTPELFVLLTGPARGYVKAGLEKAGIPYRHVYASNYSELSEFYHALDCYLVASREEGGPKAVLESMISGIPLITTRVGQAIDLVKSGQNGLMSDVGNPESLASFIEKTLRDSTLRSKMVAEGKLTATGHTFTAQLPLWKKYFSGFIEMPPISGER